MEEERSSTGFGLERERNNAGFGLEQERRGGGFEMEEDRSGAAFRLEQERSGGGLRGEERKSGAGLGSIFFVVLRILGQSLTTYCILFKSRGRGFSCAVGGAVPPSRFDRDARRRGSRLLQT